MGAPDARHQPRLLLELLLVGLGGWWAWDPVGKCFTDAVADRHGIDAQSRGDREAGSLQDLDGFPRHSDFFTFSFGHVPRAFGRSDECSCFCVRPGPGMFILIFLVIVIGVSFLLFAWRAGSVASAASFSGLSRESLLMGNNLLLVAGMAIVLLGTLYPLFLDAVGGGRITVGGPYFESVFGSAMVPLAFLVPVGAVCAWKSQSIDRMGRLLGLPLAQRLFWDSSRRFFWGPGRP